MCARRIVQGEFFFTDEVALPGAGYVERYRERILRDELFYLSVRFYDRNNLSDAIILRQEGVVQELVDAFIADLILMTESREAVGLAEHEGPHRFMDRGEISWLNTLLKHWTYYPVFSVFANTRLLNPKTELIVSVCDREVTVG